MRHLDNFIDQLATIAMTSPTPDGPSRPDKRSFETFTGGDPVEMPTPPPQRPRREVSATPADTSATDDDPVKYITQLLQERQNKRHELDGFRAQRTAIDEKIGDLYKEIRDLQAEKTNIETAIQKVETSHTRYSRLFEMMKSVAVEVRHERIRFLRGPANTFQGEPGGHGQFQVHCCGVSVDIAT